MRIGVRGHDIEAHEPEVLCKKLNALKVSYIQLVIHKSFPEFRFTDGEVLSLKRVLDHYGIHVAVYGCYIDPLVQADREKFHRHIRYAKMLGAEVIATESAVGITQLQEDEAVYQKLVEVFRSFAIDAKEVGIPVAIETVWAHPIHSPEKTRRLLEDVGVENMRVILDPVNLSAAGDAQEEWVRSQRAVELYGDRIVAIHWKNSEIDQAHPALVFAAAHENVTVITEGITGENLSKVTDLLKNT